MPAAAIQSLRETFGSALQENVSLANYTTARTGGPVEALLPVHSAEELEKAGRTLWDLHMPFIVLGSGSNVLVSDSGLPGVVILNRARNIKIDVRSEPPSVWAESGANFGSIARQAALRGLSGLEWAGTIPGTLGGAVHGNAGAYGSDMNTNLIVADILHPHGREAWTAERMQYTYRSSALKRARQASAMPGAVILSARLRLSHSDRQTVQAKMDTNAQHRRRTQPPGASMGSMFKNPEGDYAGRLIEAAGLKGTRFGDAEISPVHANFFINHGNASAADIGRLIALARQSVFEKFGVMLELEVELLGDWPAVQNNASGAGTHL
jgi:UDP-N-acetylmuramate dehydrogenase